MKTATLLLLGVLAPGLALAQTPTYTTSSKFVWIAAGNAIDAADAQQALYRLYADGSPIGDLAGVTCSAPVAPATLPACQCNLTATQAALANKRKVSFTITARDPEAGSPETGQSNAEVIKRPFSGPPGQFDSVP